MTETSMPDFGVEWVGLYGKVMITGVDFGINLITAILSTAGRAHRFAA